MRRKLMSCLSLALAVVLLISAFSLPVSAYSSPVTGTVDEVLADGFSDTDTYEIYPIVQRMETNIVPEDSVPVGMLGDVNNDGKIDSVDATLILQKYGGLAISGTFIEDFASVDNESVIDSIDATYILQYYGQLITEFPRTDFVAGEHNLSNTFTVSNEVNIVYESDIDNYTQSFLEEILTDYNRTFTVSDSLAEDKTNILLGVKNSGEAADTYLNGFTYEQIQTLDLFEKNDAYVLTAVEGTIAIVGRDTDAAFRGVSTLQMMFSSFAGKKFISAFIEDYATVEFRGFIEGMYARWDDEGRASLMRMARDVKMNTYVYASKSDVYHTSSCTELYPQEQLDAIAELVNVGKETKCYYGWSFHLSGFFSGLDTSDEEAYNAKYNKLIAKLNQLYSVGVRKFDVLNDDFGGGSNEDVVKLLNKINQEFIIPNGCKDMSYCPQGYNTAWSGSGTELEALQGLDDNIMIFWTGADVNSPMEQTPIDYASEKTGHSICTWLNYPVNEHAKSGLFLGDITHYARDGVTGQRGALSNPCLYPEASKVGVYQLACLWWNNSNYSQYAEEIWENCFKYIEPEVYTTYSKLAHNISNCYGSGRIPQGFKESEYLADTLAEALDKINSGVNITADEQLQSLLDELTTIKTAVSDMRANCTNTALLTEMEPWLCSLSDIADSCFAAIKAAQVVSADDFGTDASVSEAWDYLAEATAKLDTFDNYSYTNGDGSTSYGMSGTKRLMPFAQSVISQVNSVLANYLDPDGETPISFIGMIHGATITDTTNAAKVIDGDDSTCGTFNQVQYEGDYVGVDLGKPISVSSVRILMGSSDTDHDIIHDGVLEYSVNGTDWTEISTLTSNYLHEIQGLSVTARFVRLRVTGFNNPNNTSKKDYWMHIREFTVNYDTPAPSRVITNVSSLADIVVTDGDSSVSAALPASVTLNAGEYFGVDLGAAYKASEVSVAQIIDGAQVEYSSNAVVWVSADAADDIPIRYVRAINNSTGALTDTDAAFEISLQLSVLAPTMYANNLDNALKEGTWANVFDGNLSTYAWTNEGQITGDYITFDLGTTIDLYDLTMYFSDNPVKPRLYYADIKIATDLNGEWTTIKTFNNDLVNDYSLTDGYRVATADAGGAEARYLQIYITQDGPDNPFIRIHEIEFNKTVAGSHAANIKTSLVGELDNIIDGSLTTFFESSAPTKQGDYISVTLTEKTDISSFKVVQGVESCNAEVTAIDIQGNSHTLGTLSGSVNTFDTSALDGVAVIKLTFPEGVTPQIYEITTQK